MTRQDWIDAVCVLTIAALVLVGLWAAGVLTIAVVPS